MSVYIDDADLPFRRMIMCHMIADTTVELMVMVDKISVERRHLQRQGTCYEHFDICRSKKLLALAYGAREITTRELIGKIQQKRVN